MEAHCRRAFCGKCLIMGSAWARVHYDVFFNGFIYLFIFFFFFFFFFFGGWEGPLRLLIMSFLPPRETRSEKIEPSVVPFCGNSGQDPFFNA